MVERTDPVLKFRFTVSIGEKIAGWFTECNGLTVERKVEDYHEGGLNAYVHQLPKPLEYTRVTLKRGIADKKLWDWFRKGLYDLKVERRDISVVLYNVDKKKMKRWELKEAFPVKWTGPSFASDGNEVAFETLELVHHGFDVTDWISA